MKRTLPLLIGLMLAIGPMNAAFADGSGTFSGASNHVTKGSVSVTKNADGSAIVTFSSDFFFDGAPDPQVGFGKNGKFIAASNVGKLKSNTGSQSYKVPASINVDNFNEVYVWCVKYAVPLGVAPLG